MDSRSFGVLRPGSAPRSPVRLLLGVVTLSLVALGLMTGTASSASAAQVSTLSMTTTSMAMAPDIYEKRVQRQVNLRRANHGLRRLRLSTCPDQTAERWSRYLAMNDEFFHQSMSDVLSTCNASYAGETLGRGSMTPRRLVRMWMESPAHRAILLSSKSRRIGVGATPDAYGRWVVAANFVRF